MLPNMVPPRGAGRRLTADDWIEAGFAVLADRGPNALRVDTLCDRLNVTKGSFYWHFTDMPTYRDELAAPGAAFTTATAESSRTCRTSTRGHA